MCLHKDTPIYIPGGSVTERMLDIRAVEAQGKYTRPQALKTAAAIEALATGEIKITWRDGRVTHITCSAVATFAASGTD